LYKAFNNDFNDIMDEADNETSKIMAEIQQKTSENRLILI